MCTRAVISPPDEKLTNHTSVQGTSVQPPDIIDEFSGENDDFLFDLDSDTPVQTISCLTPNPVRADRSDDFMFDEIIPDVQVNIIEEEGHIYHCGWLGRKDKRLTKKFRKGQSAPSSKLEDFDKFCASEWLDARNKAWQGTIIHILPCHQISKPI